MVLESVKWAGNSSPYAYTIKHSKIYSVNTNILLSLPFDLTEIQRTSYRKAQIESGVVSTGQVILYAYGSKPTTDIPITLSIGGGY